MKTNHKDVAKKIEPKLNSTGALQEEFILWVIHHL